MRRLAPIVAALLVLTACHRPGLHPADVDFPAPLPGSSTVDVATANYGPDYSDGVGAFRINCARSHYGYVDPIVAPGQANASHLHVFFGNTAVTENSTTESILTTGDSTCTGGIANRSAYWAPALIDMRDTDDEGTDPGGEYGHGQVVEPWQDTNPYLMDNGAQIYYKTGYVGVEASTVQEFPEGLRIVAGQAASNSTPPGEYGVTHFYCLPPGFFAPYHRGVDVDRDCSVGHTLVQEVRFPQCWDGRNLDSPDHRSHMAYALGWPNLGCPEAHPVPLPEITVNVRYLISETTDLSQVRLSSDTYDPALPGGYSSHADWWNGWTNQPEFGGQRAIDVVVNECLVLGLDCHMNLLGDGRELV